MGWGGGEGGISTQNKRRLASATVPDTAERQADDIQDVALLLLFNGKLVFQN
jgi:hypothetical protein